MSKTALLSGFFLLATSLGAYMLTMSWHDDAIVTVKLSDDHVFDVPERNFVNRKGRSVACCIPGLRQGGPAEIFRISAEEIAQVVDGYQVMDGELEANISFLVELLDEHALERWHTPDKITSGIWRKSGYMGHSTVSRYKGTDFYRIQAKGYKTFWKLTRMPPQPSKPLPPKGEFLVASCSDENNRRTETGRLTSCESWILHQNLDISFDIYGFNLHLVDEVGEALVEKLEEWRVRPVSGSLNPPAGMTPGEYFDRLRMAEQRYSKDLLYSLAGGNALSERASGDYPDYVTYNSNGFIAGLVRATGGTAVFNDGGSFSDHLGGKHPVPMCNFEASGCP